MDKASDDNILGKFKNLFTWKKKVTFQKTRSDGSGSCEVTIEVPARHGNMPPNNFISQEVFLIPVCNSLETVFNNRTEGSLLNDAIDDKRKDNEEEKEAIGEKECKKNDYEKEKKEIQLCQVPITFVNRKHDGDKWMKTQSYVPSNSSLYSSLEDALREQIMDFEKEYHNVNEIVKKEQMMKSISVHLQESKSLT